MSETIEDLKIEKIVNKGYGLGFKDFDPIFVNFAVPGDVVDVNVSFRKKKVIFANIKEIKQASDFRIEPVCEVFGECGGCDWLNIDYPNHGKFKNEILGEIYKKIGVIPKIVPAERNLHYRNKTFMPVGLKKNEAVVGIFSKNSHKVVPHKSYYILP